MPEEHDPWICCSKALCRHDKGATTPFTRKRTKYCLVYFPTRGRAESIRLAFAQAAVEYDDIRINQEEWPLLKSKMPFRHLPVLEIDGEPLSESGPIVRYVCKTHGLFGSTPLERGLMDSYGAAALEIFDEVFAIMITCEGPEKTEKITHLSEKLPNQLEPFEELLKRNKNGFFVGDKVSYADIIVYNTMECLLEIIPTALDSNLVLKAHMELVKNTPRIKEWIEKRPKTSK